MGKTKIFAYALALLTSASCLQSCSNDSEDYSYLRRPTALVTVIPVNDNSFVMQLDDSTTLRPANMKASPFGAKEVRALVNFQKADVTSRANNSILDVKINWIDSIRTKLPVYTMGEDNDEVYGNDPIEIVKDWVTVAEDGYLTLRIRTRWGFRGAVHTINLLTGTNPDDPSELELRHDANGDINGRPGDALIAFNLNSLTNANGGKTRFKLTWTSYSGKKSLEFDLAMRSQLPLDDLAYYSLQ
ncbi:MAG: NigD-like protein [Muribaculaceae bacterium]|nr:NigD-like protein [Muribaculaceae bacterium]